MPGLSRPLRPRPKCMVVSRRTSRLWIVTVALAVCVWPGDLAAHTDSSLRGFLHPLSGPGHVLAAFSLGALAYFADDSRFWTVLAAFFVLMSLGAIVVPPNPSLTMIGESVPVSLLLLGILLAISEFLSLWVIALVVGAIGLAQGITLGTHPHYVGGFMLGTATAMGAGALLAFAADALSSTIAVRRMTGITVGLVGLLMLTH